MNKTFNELQEYLNKQSVYGFTCTKRKTTLIYTFIRYYIGRKLFIKVKIDRETKQVISVNHQGKIYTDFDELKKLVEQ